MGEAAVQVDGAVAEAAGGAAGRGGQGVERLALDGAVAQLLGVQLGRVGRQPFEPMVGGVGGHERLHARGPMGVAPVPGNDQRPADPPPDVAQGGDDLRAVAAAADVAGPKWCRGGPAATGCPTGPTVRRVPWGRAGGSRVRSAPGWPDGRLLPRSTADPLVRAAWQAFRRRSGRGRRCATLANQAFGRIRDWERVKSGGPIWPNPEIRVRKCKLGRSSGSSSIIDGQPRAQVKIEDAMGVHVAVCTGAG
jgi:hypothetical protein